MNPSNNETSGIQLPPPVMEQAPQAAPAEQAASVPAEQAPVGAERAPAAAAVVPSLPTAPPPPLPTSSGQPPVSTATASLSASDDTDLIEKEWVDKAKAIVERTRDDPYKQSEELTMVKADYLQKRYNKTIKLNK